jgi:hypothetical protein
MWIGWMGSQKVRYGMILVFQYLMKALSGSVQRIRRTTG